MTELTAIKRPYRLYGLLALCAGLLGVYGYSLAEEASMRSAVTPFAEEHAAEFAAEGHDVTSLVTVSREAVLFGTAHAKVEVYVRPPGPENTEVISGIEYHYIKENGAWRMTDSGMCSGEECRERGLAAFARE